VEGLHSQYSTYVEGQNRVMQGETFRKYMKAHKVNNYDERVHKLAEKIQISQLDKKGQFICVDPSAQVAGATSDFPSANPSVISMINLENLADMSHRHHQGLLALTDDIDERNYIMSKPFGGIHILFTGDFYQLRPIFGPGFYTDKVLTGKALAGQIIWHHTLNEYEELTENYRFKNDTSNILQSFLKRARIGKIDKR
jgi:PIF1-like helicase